MPKYHWEWAAARGPRRLTWHCDDFESFNDSTAADTARFEGAAAHDRLCRRYDEVVVGWQVSRVEPVGTIELIAEGKN